MEFKPTNYPSDLTDSYWEQIKEYFPQNENSMLTWKIFTGSLISCGMLSTVSAQNESSSLYAAFSR